MMLPVLSSESFVYITCKTLLLSECMDDSYSYDTCGLTVVQDIA